MKNLTKLEAIKRRRAKWVKALRSGKYRQGSGCLRPYGGRYCCLGVANAVCKLGDPGHALLRLPSLKKLGLSWKQQDHLTTPNDRDHKSFDQIAASITRMKISGPTEKKGKKS